MLIDSFNPGRMQCLHGAVMDSLQKQHPQFSRGPGKLHGDMRFRFDFHDLTSVPECTF